MNSLSKSDYIPVSLLTKMLLILIRSSRSSTRVKRKLSSRRPRKFWCSFVAFSKAINYIQLIPQHIEELQKTPFGHLFDAFITNKAKHERNYGEVSKKIIEQYNTKDQTFKIGRENIQYKPWMSL